MLCKYIQVQWFFVSFSWEFSPFDSPKYKLDPICYQILFSKLNIEVFLLFQIVMKEHKKIHKKRNFIVKSINSLCHLESKIIIIFVCTQRIHIHFHHGIQTIFDRQCYAQNVLFYRIHFTRKSYSL